MSDITQKIKLEGEAEYKKALREIQAQAKLSDSELKKLSSSFDDSTSKEEKASKMSEAYSERLSVQKKQIDLMRSQLEKATAAYGENSEYVTRLKTSLNNAETAYNKTANEARNYGKEVEDSTSKTSVFGDVLKANLASEAIKAGLSAMVNGVKALGNALKSCVTDAAAFADEILTESTVTGLSTDALQEYQYMAELTDTSVDTITGSLTKLTKNMQTAKKGTGDAATAFEALGINVTDANGELRSNQAVFEEALTALSAMENETQADAYAMQIFGRSAQDLKPLMAVGAEGLAQLRQEAHDTGYVLDEMSLQSLGAVDDSLQRMSKATESLKNNLAVAFAPAIEGIVSQVGESINGLVTAYKEGGVDGLLGAVGDMVTQFAQKIIEAAPEIIAKGSEFLGNLVTGITESLPSIMDSAFTVINTFLEGLITNLPALVEGAFRIITSLVDGITNNLPQIVVAAIRIIGQLAVGLIKGIPNLIKKIPEIVVAIVKAFLAAREEFLNIGKDIVLGIWEGIKSLASWLYDSVCGFFSGIVDSVKETLGIASPSKVFASIGKYSAEGFGVGFEKSFSGVGNNVLTEVAKAPVTLYNSFNFNGGYSQQDGKAIVRQINRQLGALYV